MALDGDCHKHMRILTGVTGPISREIHKLPLRQQGVEEGDQLNKNRKALSFGRLMGMGGRELRSVLCEGVAECVTMCCAAAASDGPRTSSPKKQVCSWIFTFG